MPARFPPPYTIHDTRSSWEVRDANGFAIVWFTYVERPVVGTGPDRMTRDQARRFAVNFARLPELLKASQKSAPGGRAEGAA